MDKFLRLSGKELYQILAEYLESKAYVVKVNTFMGGQHPAIKIKTDDDGYYYAECEVESKHLLDKEG